MTERKNSDEVLLNPNKFLYLILIVGIYFEQSEQKSNTVTRKIVFKLKNHIKNSDVTTKFHFAPSNFSRDIGAMTKQGLFIKENPKKKDGRFSLSLLRLFDLFIYSLEKTDKQPSEENNNTSKNFENITETNLLQNKVNLFK